jgi:hypothetical protein
MNSLIFACSSLYVACTKGVILAEDDVLEADVLTDLEEVDVVDECEAEVGTLVISTFSSYSSSFGGGGAAWTLSCSDLYSCHGSVSAEPSLKLLLPVEISCGTLALPKVGRSYLGRYSEYVELRTSTTIARKTSTVRTASRRGDPKGESSMLAAKCEQRGLLYLTVVGM